MSYRIINDLGDGRIEYYGVSFGFNLFSSNESEAYIYPTLKDASKTLFKLGKNFEKYFPNSNHDIGIDEFADLMYTSKKEIEIQIIRLAQKARAIGIHLILATQRPSVNVITGILKANIPTRIAFQVASQIDSRTILDCMGAEKLKGKGDLLLKEVSESEAKNYQGIYISDSEIENIVCEVEEKYSNDTFQVKISSDNENNDTRNILDLVIQKCNERRARIQKILI